MLPRSSIRFDCELELVTDNTVFTGFSWVISSHAFKLYIDWNVTPQTCITQFTSSSKKLCADLWLFFFSFICAFDGWDSRFRTNYIIHMWNPICSKWEMNWNTDSKTDRLFPVRVLTSFNMFQEIANGKEKLADTPDTSLCVDLNCNEDSKVSSLNSQMMTISTSDSLQNSGWDKFRETFHTPSIKKLQPREPMGKWRNFHPVNLCVILLIVSKKQKMLL